MDYNPVKEGLTKCEFIKIKDANPFIASSGIVTGGWNDALPSGDLFPQIRTGNKANVFENINIVSGGNYVADTATGAIVTGTRNHVGAGASNISIFNSSGVTVLAGVTGVNVINSSGIVVSQNNQTYINGSLLPSNMTPILYSSGVVSYSSDLAAFYGSLTSGTIYFNSSEQKLHALQRKSGQTEVDFGSTPVSEMSFSIFEPFCNSSSRVIASMAYDAPTGKDLDELEMDNLIIRAGNCIANEFTLYISSSDGSYLEGKFKINYLII
jgi:hypothetical protein